ncbi:MAG: Ku protein [Actinomycetota bacterium]|nr:Ku protein [Actinomycetota bacterium]
MPKSIWKGAITFGLITIPVGLYSALDEKDIRFNQLHDDDMGRIRYKRQCEECGQEVGYDHIVKGYEFEKGNYVTFTDEELDRLPADSVRAIDIVSFVPLEQIDPIYFQKSYYVAPEPSGIKAYKLLEQAMAASGKVGIAKITLREKEHLATLRVRDDVFVLETMHWPDEIREPEFEELQKKAEIREQEVKMAESLIDNLSDDFHPEQFVDSYRSRLEEAVEAKIAGQQIAVAPQKEPAQVMDLMEALRASVEATKSKSNKEDPTDEAEGAEGAGGDEPVKQKAKAKAK